MSHVTPTHESSHDRPVASPPLHRTRTCSPLPRPRTRRTSRSSTSSIIVDPMHALQLNAGKVVWKWTIGNRMDAEGRERVADFLNEINVMLDIREKGKRDRNQKWFTASAFDEFVLGIQWDKKSKSLGLAHNVYAIIERVYADATRDTTAARIVREAAPQQAAPQQVAQPLPKPAAAKGRRKRVQPR